MKKLPNQVIWAVVIIVALPISLNGLGFDFSTVRPRIEPTTILELGSPELIDDYVHLSLGGSFTHTFRILPMSRPMIYRNHCEKFRPLAIV
ncbi:MAG: hypothetical protein ACO31I_01605 [Prochlorotrichaceae cyanobacterium]|jgi:hypothetical protein